MKSAFWLFIGLFLGFGLSYVAYLKAEPGQQFAQHGDDAEVEAMRQAADRVAQRQPARVKREEKKLKSKFGQYLMDLLDGVQGGTDEERQLVEDTLRENDAILHEVLEEDLSAKIRAANNRHGRQRGVTLPPPVERQPRNFVERPEQASVETQRSEDETPVVDPADAI